MDATPQQQLGGGIASSDCYGVLLYDKYAEVPDAAALAAFYEAHCRGLALVGRVRVSPDGVKATLRGQMTVLEQHIAEMSSNNLFDGTDFKLASCDDPVDERVARECGFTSLSVWVVKELVTLCSNLTSAPPEISSAGRHLSDAEFHSVLQSVGSEQPKKLRVLCLHGFRQNASNFKGRTSALAKKLKHIAELVFIDAPHELSFVYQPIQSNCSDKSSPPSVTAKRKFAWLIAPNASSNAEQDWKVADTPFDPLQYQQQTEGFEESYAYLENALSDGYLRWNSWFLSGCSNGCLILQAVTEDLWLSEIQVRNILLRISSTSW